MSYSTPARAAVAPSSPDRRVWTSLDALVVLVMAFILYVVADVILAVIYYIAAGKHTPFWLGPVSYLFLPLSAALVIYLWLIKRRWAPLSSQGFRVPVLQGMRGLIVLPAVLIPAMIAIYIGEAIIIEAFDHLTSFHIKGNARELLLPGQTHISVGQYVLLMVVAALAAPITEETLFRGVVFQAIRSDVSGSLGTALTVAVAAVVSVLALTFQFSDSLASSAFVHGCFNGIAVTVLFLR